jgi:hypothetical protein
MDIRELISPDTLSPVKEKKDTGVAMTREQIAIGWLRLCLWELPETKDLKEVHHNCVMAGLTYQIFLNGAPIVFSESAQKQWKDWWNKKFPYPPTCYWEDEHSQPVYFKLGQIIDIQIDFPEGKQVARYRIIEDYGYNDCEMKLIEEY